MNDNEFYATVWKLGTAIVVTIILAVSGCNVNSTYQTRLLIERSHVSPLEAACAFGASQQDQALCAIRAAK